MPPRVVVVDDSFDMRLLLRVYLERRGLLVIGEAESLGHGSEVSSALRPDAIVADVHLADTNDLRKIVTELRRAAPDARIIALSAAPPPAHERQALSDAIGCDGYLDKGDGVGPLADQIAHLLEDPLATH